jgi:HEPN domain-containing protein
MQDSFSSSAGRHLQDAQILASSQRWDNAVYLAGYVVECSFKVLIEQTFKSSQGAARKYGHDLTELEGKAMERLRILYPILDQKLPSSRMDGTVLAQSHPQRRYARSGFWGKAEAELAIQRAEAIYKETVLKLVLDGLILSQDI